MASASPAFISRSSRSFAKKIPAFANGTHHVINPPVHLVVLHDGPDMVERVVERRADEIVHPGVHDHKLLHVGLFDIDHPVARIPLLAAIKTSGFEDEPAFSFFEDRQDLPRELFRGLGILVTIDRAQAAAQVQEFDPGPGRFQFVDEFHDLLERFDERFAGLDLGTDVHMDSRDLGVGEALRALEDLTGFLEIDAELGLGFSGRDVFVRVRVDVGIDPDRNVHMLSHLLGDRIDLLELGHGFHIKKEGSGP